MLRIKCTRKQPLKWLCSIVNEYCCHHLLINVVLQLWWWLPIGQCPISGLVYQISLASKLSLLVYQSRKTWDKKMSAKKILTIMRLSLMFFLQRHFSKPVAWFPESNTFWNKIKKSHPQFHAKCQSISIGECMFQYNVPSNIIENSTVHLVGVYIDD